MKHLKLPSLAAMVIAAAAAFAAAPASATEIYSGATTLKSGTKIEASLSGTASLTTTGGTVLDTCTGGGVTGTTSNTGGSGVAVKGTVAASGVTWTGCTKTTDTLEGGTAELAYTSGTNGRVGGVGFKVTVEMVAEFGGTCSYTLHETGGGGGTVNGSSTGTATVSVNDTINGASGNSFLCPSDVKWVANYTVTSPKPLHVTNA